jgi:hypothetical protein
LNTLTIKKLVPTLDIEDLLDNLQGATIFSLDLTSGYHEIKMQEHHIAKNARKHETFFFLCLQLPPFPFYLAINPCFRFYAQVKSLLGILKSMSKALTPLSHTHMVIMSSF